jgi:hypothetical protein
MGSAGKTLRLLMMASATRSMHASVRPTLLWRSENQQQLPHTSSTAVLQLRGGSGAVIEQSILAGLCVAYITPILLLLPFSLVLLPVTVIGGFSSLLQMLEGLAPLLFNRAITLSNFVCASLLSQGSQLVHGEAASMDPRTLLAQSMLVGATTGVLTAFASPVTAHQLHSIGLGGDTVTKLLAVIQRVPLTERSTVLRWQLACGLLVFAPLGAAAGAIVANAVMPAIAASPAIVYRQLAGATALYACALLASSHRPWPHALPG